MPPSQGRALVPYARHSIGRRERAAVARSLASPWVAQGPLSAAFERGLARVCGTREVIAVSSGTAALQVALAALGVGPGDEVIVPPITFVATANAVLACGATPVFADVEPDTLNLDPAAVARAVTRRTRGAIPVHYAGHPADVDAIADALGPRRFVLEDACHALGAKIGKRRAGALGDAACFSFHPAKAITTGEGGAISTDRADTARAARLVRDHGLERERAGHVGLGLPRGLRTEEQGAWVYEMQRLGANHRLSEPQAALGLAQLERLTAFLRERRAIARAYARDLAGEAALALPTERPGVRSAWHLYAVRVRKGALRGGRAALFQALRARGIGVQVHYVPVHLQPYYRKRFRHGWGAFPVAEAAYLELLSLPLFPALAARDRARVVATLTGRDREAAPVIALFTVFHANLDFSALPDADVPLVLERCYWPLLRLADDDRLPLGIEMSARTLARIAREDPEWTKALRSLAEQGLVEVVGSGLAQIAAPLAPADLNRANVALGRSDYEALLGASPTTWFVHEQTFSQGLGSLYAEQGVERLVMEWNNPATQRPELRALRRRPARLALPDGSAGPALLWNDSAVFQKLQRVAHAQAPLAEYLDFVLRDDTAQLACAYGGDLEIFDYRPGHAAPAGAERGAEMARLREALVALARDARCRFVLPRDAQRGLEPGPVVALASAGDPIPCKKQPRYNPTRWAVSGRDAIGMNTRCFALRRELAAAVALDGGSAGWRELVPLWRSDLRTRATDEKVAEFHERAGRLGAELRERLAAATPALPAGADALLVNASGEAWEGEVVEIELRLPPGRLQEGSVRALPESALDASAAQLEVQERHRDGSVRRAKLVVAPRLAPGERLALRLVPRRAEAAADAVVATAERLATAAVDARFAPLRGAALATLRFPALAAGPLVGTIPHGRFDDVAFTPDFYSAHAVAVTEQGEKVADLQPAAGFLAQPGGPLRASLTTTTRTALGEWRKTYRAYHDRPRLDVVHEIHLREVRLASLRVATLTWLPEAFARDALRFSTVNGGPALETFAIPRGARIEHPRAAAPSVSATSCLGATEGFVSAGDDRLGVAILGDRAQAALVPLLEFREVDDEYLLRVHHTAAETDETRATFFRGVLRFAVAIVGHRADALALLRRSAGALARGLVYRTEHAVGISGGL